MCGSMKLQSKFVKDQILYWSNSTEISGIISVENFILHYCVQFSDVQ